MSLMAGAGASVAGALVAGALVAGAEVAGAAVAGAAVGVAAVPQAVSAKTSTIRRLPKTYIFFNILFSSESILEFSSGED
jgi:hypothetical protein